MPLRALIVMGAVVGCASAPPQPEPEPTTRSRHEMVNPLVEGENEDENDGMTVEGALGTLDPGAIDSGLAPVLPRVTDCFQRRLATQPYLGGEVVLGLRVARDGTVKTARLTRSTLGSVEVERCIVEAAGRAVFERPRGGEAELSYPLTFSSRVPSVAWDPGMVRQELEQAREKLTLVSRGGEVSAAEIPDGLVLTFYVDRAGRAVSAGMVAEGKLEDAFVSHFVEQLKKVRFVAPDSPYAKVTIRW